MRQEGRQADITFRLRQHLSILLATMAAKHPVHLLQSLVLRLGQVEPDP